MLIPCNYVSSSHVCTSLFIVSRTHIFVLRRRTPIWHRMHHCSCYFVIKSTAICADGILILLYFCTSIYLWLAESRYKLGKRYLPFSDIRNNKRVVCVSIVLFMLNTLLPFWANLLLGYSCNILFPHKGTLY